MLKERRSPEVEFIRLLSKILNLKSGAFAERIGKQQSNVAAYMGGKVPGKKSAALCVAACLRMGGDTWMLLRTSPIRRLSDSIVTDGSELIRCEGRQDFSMSMID